MLHVPAHFVCVADLLGYGLLALRCHLSRFRRRQYGNCPVLKSVVILKAGGTQTLVEKLARFN
jgi:hypothetical protein